MHPAAVGDEWSLVPKHAPRTGEQIRPGLDPASRTRDDLAAAVSIRRCRAPGTASNSPTGPPAWWTPASCSSSPMARVCRSISQGRAATASSACSGPPCRSRGSTSRWRARRRSTIPPCCACSPVSPWEQRGALLRRSLDVLQGRPALVPVARGALRHPAAAPGPHHDSRSRPRPPRPPRPMRSGASASTSGPRTSTCTAPGRRGSGAGRCSRSSPIPTSTRPRPRRSARACRPRSTSAGNCSCPTRSARASAPGPCRWATVRGRTGSTRRWPRRPATSCSCRGPAPCSARMRWRFSPRRSSAIPRPS